MSINPYQAPSAAVSDFVPPPDGDGELLDTPQRRPAGHGAEWLSAAWGLYRQAPWLWIGMFVVMMALIIVVSMVPLAGMLLPTIATPLLWGGMMVGCDAQRRGEPLEFAHLFAGFSRNTGQLLLAGVIYAIALLLIALITFVPIGVFGAMMFAGGAESIANDPTMFILMMMLGFLIYMALALPVIMAAWFAPALIILDDKPAIDAFRLSFTGCLRNIVPFLIYGLLGMALAIAASLPLFLGWFVLGPVIYISAYSAYRDIFFTEAG
jgi:hypothetical protein